MLAELLNPSLWSVIVLFAFIKATRLSIFSSDYYWTTEVDSLLICNENPQKLSINKSEQNIIVAIRRY